MGQPAFVNTNPTAAKPAAARAAKPRALTLNFDWVLLVASIALLGFGLLMAYSASLWLGAFSLDNISKVFGRQFFLALLGIMAAGIVFLIGYHRIGRRAVLLLMAVTIIALLAVLFFGEEPLGGGRKTLPFGLGQPSELAKLAIVIYLSYWLFTKGDQLAKTTTGFLPAMAIIGIVAGLVLVQVDVSAAATIVLLGVMLFYIAGGQWRQIFLVIVIACVIGALVLMVYPYAADRLKEWLAGLKDFKAASDQAKWTMQSVANGGVFGVGIGRGTSKYEGMPLPHSDSIFAVVVEETGLLGGLFMFGLYFVIFWRGIRIAEQATDAYGRNLAAGITLWIFFEALFNIGNIVSIFPIGGNALPLVSIGGSSLITTLVGLGLLLSVSQSNAAAKWSPVEGRTYSAAVNLRGRDRRRSVSRPVHPANPR